MKKNREEFMEHYYQAPDYFHLVEMFNLIVFVSASNSDSLEKVKDWVSVKTSPSNDLAPAYDRLIKLSEQTKAWIRQTEKGLYRVERIIFKTRVLHDGWELDNEVWITEFEGEKSLRATHHGGEIALGRKEFLEKITETEKSLEGLKQAGQMIGWIEKPVELARHW